jgi:uncharacterized NAD(P)/FAD-binding protein YdhS
MNRPTTLHAIIIGGGASGVLLAYQLLQNPDSDLRVTLVEKRSDIGRGLAYHTGDPGHLLNVRVANMSALPDDPEHFWRWLSTHAERPLCPDPYCFVPRRIYGDYLASLIEPLMSGEGASRRLGIVRGECIGISEDPAKVAVTLADGTCHVGEIAILATGHDAAGSNPPCRADPWPAASTVGVGKDATVLILGTGLTMVDYVLSLLRDRHRGQIIACRDAACCRKRTTEQILRASREPMSPLAQARASCCAGSVSASMRMSRTAATGVVWSMQSGPLRNGSGASYRSRPNGASSNMRAPGGTCIVTAWRRRCRRASRRRSPLGA